MLLSATGWNQFFANTIDGNTSDGIRIGAGGHHTYDYGAGTANHIWTNGGKGINVLDGEHHRFLQNSIYNNGALGIDLNNDGVTANDYANPPTTLYHDLDSGPNRLQNFPQFTGTFTDPTRLEVTGFLKSDPNTTFRLEYFINHVSDPSNHGEGEIFLGGTFLTTDANGEAGFVFEVPPNNPLAGTWYLTATATNLTTDNTSEFAANILVVIPPQSGGGMGAGLPPLEFSSYGEGDDGDDSDAGGQSPPDDPRIELPIRVVFSTVRAGQDPTPPRFATGIRWSRAADMLFAEWELASDLSGWRLVRSAYPSRL